MLSAECWIARHSHCAWGKDCYCMCHITVDELIEDAGD